MFWLAEFFDFPPSIFIYFSIFCYCLFFRFSMEIFVCVRNQYPLSFLISCCVHSLMFFVHLFCFELSFRCRWTEIWWFIETCIEIKWRVKLKKRNSSHSCIHKSAQTIKTCTSMGRVFCYVMRATTKLCWTLLQ